MGIKTHETDNIGSYSSILYISNGLKLINHDPRFQRNRHVLNHLLANFDDPRTKYLQWFIYTYGTNAAPTTIDEFLNTQYNLTNNNNQNYALHKIYPEGLSNSIGAVNYKHIGNKVIQEINGTQITNNKIWHPDIMLTTDVSPWGYTDGQFEANAIINGAPASVLFQNWHRITGQHPLAIHVAYSILRRVSLHMIYDRTTSNYEKMVNRKKLKDAESKLEKRLRDDKLI